MTIKMVSPRDLSELLNIPVQTSYQWRCRGERARLRRIGRHVRYRVEDIEAPWTTRRKGQPREGGSEQGLEVCGDRPLRHQGRAKMADPL